MRLIEAQRLQIGIKSNRKVLLISPFSRITRDKDRSPKDYPYWESLVQMAKDKGYYVVQIGVHGEEDIGAHEKKFNQKLKYLEHLIQFSDTWISVDNFFHHLAWSIKKSGIVIWGPSDPRIFGHDLHLNILKDRKFLRERQFGEWHEIKHDPEIFPSPEFIAEEL